MMVKPPRLLEDVIEREKAKTSLMVLTAFEQIKETVDVLEVFIQFNLFNIEQIYQPENRLTKHLQGLMVTI